MANSLKDLSNLLHRHEWYISKTFAIPYEDMWIGITMAFITHIRYEAKPFNLKMTPYTPEGRMIYVNYRNKNKPLPKDRPSINTIFKAFKQMHIIKQLLICITLTFISLFYNFLM